MSFIENTTDYENWLRTHCNVIEADLKEKHAKMDADAFEFFRGTYYRWARSWPKWVPDLAGPKVLAIGDLHLENFGTWRDDEGRLVWGVNDFDEADTLPYTNDLARLAASLRFAALPASADVKFHDACGHLVRGYHDCLQAGGRPFVLEEANPVLRDLATRHERNATDFWDKLLSENRHPADPGDAKELLRATLPKPGPIAGEQFLARQAGVGSLGRPRFLLLGTWHGANVAREAKAVLPPATAWAAGATTPTRMAEILERAVRSPDPYYRPGPKWVVRRLGPRCSRIELKVLQAHGETAELLAAMGAETANVHLGTPTAKDAILADLKRRPADWLADAAKQLAREVQDDWQKWKARPRA